MTDWEDLRHFAALAQSGSLSAAARRLGVEHATVARRVTALEHDLALKLVDRRGRRLTLTADGVRVAAHLGAMEESALAVARVAAGARETIAGEVQISAPHSLAAAKLVAPLAELRRRHPGLALHLLGETRSASLDRREAEIAIRLSRPAEGDLVIRKLGEIAFAPYATAAYLANTPETDRRFIGYDAALEEAPQQVALRSLAADRPFALVASTLEIQLAAVRAGMGIAMLPEFMVEPGLDLTHVACEPPVPSREVWLAIHADLRNAAPIRAVAEAIEAAFR
ncbi:LysR family transcriptional regulator [Bosea sp. (in: a-proteobacteria)]|uniref:LysR family transcriptional regulator n=1 Tax=Bosea sp. (in: a-proteobacteria) TaxID=1871050 RepID=UPI002629FAC3|nr:LysR family transcriptional regulator [Bosea sp. (in: a-proteobacteria)]MCO5092742.1 LysR family transcriptional regulator [Bosea sp. (in: a-proteobacteria)]